MSWIVIKELLLKQLHFIVACIIALVCAAGWVYTEIDFKQYKLDVMTEQSQSKDKVIERQTEINKLTERFITNQERLEKKYADSFNTLSNQLTDLRNNSDRVSNQTKEIRTTIFTNTDTAYANEVAATYTNLYDELKQFTLGASEQADRATEEAFKQYESCKVMVDEYNTFKAEADEKKDR